MSEFFATSLSRPGKSQGNCPLGRTSLRSNNSVGAVYFMPEASRAEDRPLLRRLEWHRCAGSALGARHGRFNSTQPLAGFCQFPLGLALLAVSRFVDESLLSIELLFTRREHELRTAIYTEYISVGKLLHKPSLNTQQIQKVQGGRSRSVNPLRRALS